MYQSKLYEYYYDVSELGTFTIGHVSSYYGYKVFLLTFHLTLT